MKAKSKRQRILGTPESSVANLAADVRSELDARLARVEGHVAAIRRMMAAGEDCDALLVQASAVRSALNGILAGLLEAHLNSCVIPCARQGDAEEAIGRLRGALATVLRRS
ncbi:MAG: metal-sensitive transcriptional regulator [Thermoanaerobaculia bacterium]